MSVIKVNVKWGKQKYDVELDTSEPPIVFKSQIYALTGVPTERQKIAVKGGMLKDEANWATLNIKEGHSFMMMGTADEVPKEPEQKTVFLEDLSADQAQGLTQSIYPPGLVNLGNTCYMNSTLQCFRAVPELSSALKGFSGRAQNNDVAAGVTAALRDLFINMEASNAPVPPIVFLQVFRLAFPQFAEQSQAGGFKQQDAEECWTQLLLCLSQKLGPLRVEGAGPAEGAAAAAGGGGAPSESAVGQLFNVQLTSSLKCVEAEGETPTGAVETLTKLSVHISANTNFMIDGLREGLEEQLTKQSPTLGREARYLKSSRISRLPYYLGIQFVRFFWKQSVGVGASAKPVGVKIVRPVEFPFILDLYEFCTPELQARLLPRRRLIEEIEERRVHGERLKRKATAENEEGSKGKEKAPAEEAAAAAAAAAEKAATVAAAAAAADADAEMKDALPPTAPYTNETGRYELIAVLTHKGRAADAGHYVAWVKLAEDSWLKYDDEKVSTVNNEEIKKLNGRGGADAHIAYLCLYKSI